VGENRHRSFSTFFCLFVFLIFRPVHHQYCSRGDISSTLIIDNTLGWNHRRLECRDETMDVQNAEGAPSRKKLDWWSRENTQLVDSLVFRVHDVLSLFPFIYSPNFPKFILFALFKVDKSFFLALHLRVGSRVARFFSVQYTKIYQITIKLPTSHKMPQMAFKCSKGPWNTPKFSF
jgi:hypothetical protein